MSHVLPGTGELVDRLRRARVPYRRAYENVARGGSALAAHEAAEESPAHLANLLAPGVARVGVGIARGPAAVGGHDRLPHRDPGRARRRRRGEPAHSRRAGARGHLGASGRGRAGRRSRRTPRSTRSRARRRRTCSAATRPAPAISTTGRWRSAGAWRRWTCSWRAGPPTRRARATCETGGSGVWGGGRDRETAPGSGRRPHVRRRALHATDRAGRGTRRRGIALRIAMPALGRVALQPALDLGRLAVQARTGCRSSCSSRASPPRRGRRRRSCRRGSGGPRPRGRG